MASPNYYQQKGEQLEEGEIIDENEFEDILSSSEESVILLPSSEFGKFASTNQRLRALSLSSVSDETDIIEKCRHNKRRRRRRFEKQEKRKTTLKDDDNSDNSDNYNDLKEKFKKAIHISGIEFNKRNSLRTRLGMESNNNEGEGESPTEGSNNNEGEGESPAEHINDKPSEIVNKERFEDPELEVLRLEALRTAVLNKCIRRKKRKLQEIEDKVEKFNNKENDVEVSLSGKEISEDSNKKPCLEQNIDKKPNEEVNNIDIEEDEDVLRACLLAGISKKITKIQDNTTNLSKSGNQLKIQPKLQVKRVKNANLSMKRKLVVNNLLKKKNVPIKRQITTMKPTIVKPLIINVSNDSDTDDEKIIKPKPTIHKLQKQIDLEKMSTTVDRFLKEQRAKVELLQQRKKLLTSTSILEKSSVKLLPKSQQIEYQELLKKLKNAEKMNKIKKSAIPVKAIPTSTVTIVPTSPTTVVTTVATTTATTATNTIDCDLLEKSQFIRDSKFSVISEISALQKVLKEIKVVKNGSFQNQMKTQYQTLTPIIKKINDTSLQRKKHEIRIRKLEQELNGNKKQLTKCYTDFSTLVKKLVEQKQEIDKKIRNEEEISNEARIDEGKPATSTPIKRNSDKDLIIEDESVIEKNTNRIDENETVIENRTVIENDKQAITDSDEFDDIAITDPNDIDKIFKVRNNVNFPKYISPLNNCERYNNVDPLGIMCPYEVNGSCRDIDCTFKHYLKPI